MRSEGNGMNEPQHDCDLCPVFAPVPATHTYTDRQGNVWWMCRRHHQPIEDARNRREWK